MKTVLKTIGFFAMVISLAGMVLTSLDGYHENVAALQGYTATAVLGFVLFLFASEPSKEVKDQSLEDDFVRIQREYFLEKSFQNYRELEEEEKKSLVQ